ncbi:MAG: hypothetical protein RTU30_09090 [Candidatus Thorarchaeota archaeon]
MPAGYETLIMVFAPSFGNYLRPTAVMLNLLIVDPMNNPISLALWAVAGLIGGVMAGTKKGGFVVGLCVWLSCLGIIAFSVFMMFQSGLDFGSISLIMPPGYSFTDFLSVPIVQSLIGILISVVTGIGEGGTDVTSMIMAIVVPLAIFFLIPVATVIITGIIGGAIRPKE